MSTATSVSVYDSLFTELLEQVPALFWPRSNTVYGQMRTDPQLTAVLNAYALPIRRATWAVNGDGARPAVTAFVAEQLGLRVKGDDAAARHASAVRWGQFIRIAMQHLVYGHMPFEKTYDTSDGKTARLAGLVERLPVTIGDIRVDPRTNKLLEITQLPFSMGGNTVMPILPASALVWFDHDREGAAYQGRSMLRPAYGSWLLKHELWRVHATSIRRFGMGIPEVTAPTGGTPQQTAQAQQLASAIRVGDQSGVGLPAGFQLQLKGMIGTVPDALAAIQYFDQQMARSCLAGFLDLGQSSHGSHALGTSLVDLLMLSEQAVADHMAEVITADLVTDLVALNFGEDEPAPVVEVGDVGSRHVVTAEAIQMLLACGAIQPDPALEAFLRREWSLPANTLPWKAEAPAAPGTPGGSPAPGAPDVPAVAAGARAHRGPRKARAAAGALRRQPTDVEAAAQTDFDTVQADWADALDTLVAEWLDKVTAKQRAELGDQVAAAVDGGDLEALASLSAKVPAAAGILKQAMVALAGEAADAIAAEADSQGVTVTVPAIDDDHIGQVAATVAALLAGGLAASAGRKAMQLATPAAAAADVADAVETFLAGLSEASLRDALGAALSTAQNTGRLAVLAAAPEADYYASEILDSNTCEPCAAVDGQKFDTLDDAEAAYANGGYVECDGGLRCRGIVVAVWNAGSDTGDQQAA